jgi:hypothetical protein
MIDCGDLERMGGASGTIQAVHTLQRESSSQNSQQPSCSDCKGTSTCE